jgi:2,4-dienoyl-CoA reductase-like NADH-dependent reductase (Old Yellow Enzyme family)
MSESRFPNVFQPMRLGPVEVSNRIYIPPHGIPVDAPTPGHEAHTVPAQELPYYFGERAAGGVGLIFHSTQVGPAARHQYVKHTPWFAEAIPSYGRVAEAVHEHGTKIMAEIWHAGYASGMWEPLGPKAPQLGASATAFFAEAAVCYAMGREDMRELIDAHAQSTRHLRQAGYDGIEVHLSHSTTLEYFLSPSFNKRTDEYGGSLENRVRLIREVLEVVREECGDEMAVGIRISADELLPDGVGTTETAEIIRILRDRELIDFVDLDVSVEPDQMHLMTTPFLERPLHNAERVAEVSRQVRPFAVLAAPGRVTAIAEAETLIADGVVDMVGAVRGHIAEPNLVRHAREGHPEASRVCIAANHCFEAPASGGFGCAINPEAGKEIKWGGSSHTPAPNPMVVVVVGGGPAGAEAARIAAIRGHAVTLLERRDALGGGLETWSRLPGRGQVAKQVKWWTARLEQLEVDVRTGVDADAEVVLALAPEVVVLAAGSTYAGDGENGMTRAPVAGWQNDIAVAVDVAIREDDWPTQGNVVVLDDEGFHAGVGAAEAAAEAGATVELVTRKTVPGDQLLWANMTPYVLTRLAKAGVRTSTFTFIKEIGADSVTLTDVLRGEERVVRDVTRVVLATMRKPVSELSGLEGEVPYLYVVGDGLAPRSLREATYEGYRFGRVIGDDDMPRRVMDEIFRERQPLRPAEVVIGAR